MTRSAPAKVKASVVPFNRSLTAKRASGGEGIAGLVEAASAYQDLGQFLEAVGAGSVEEPLYLWDWSIPQQCPELLEHFTLPRYIASDVMHWLLPRKRHFESK